jgi:CrcB protein
LETLSKYLAVAFGGAIGACLRYYIGTGLLSRMGLPFPTATFVINVTGSFIIGFFLTLATERLKVDPYFRLIVAVGFVGAYTTFSTFEYETARLFEDKELLYAFLYVVLSFVIGFAAVWGGIITARKLVQVETGGQAIYLDLRSPINFANPKITGKPDSREIDLAGAHISDPIGLPQRIIGEGEES